MKLKNPVGKKVNMWDKEKTIIGIVVVAKINASQEKSTIDRIRILFGEFNKGLSFDFRFVDEAYEKLYASENRAPVLSRWFAGLAMLISCLGLFGLSAFTAQRRQKETGIRKVAGAAVHQITLMLSRDSWSWYSSPCSSLSLSPGGQ